MTPLLLALGLPFILSVPVSLHEHSHTTEVNPDHYRIGLEVELPCAWIEPRQNYATIFAMTEEMALGDIPKLMLVAERHNANAHQIFELVFGPLPTSLQTVNETRAVSKAMHDTLRANHRQLLQDWLPLYNAEMENQGLDSFKLRWVQNACGTRASHCVLCAANDDACGDGTYRTSLINKTFPSPPNVQVNYDIPLAAVARSGRHDWFGLHGTSHDGMKAIPPIRKAVNKVFGKLSLTGASSLDKCEAKGLLVLYTWMVLGKTATAHIDDATSFKSWYTDLPKVKIHNLAELLHAPAQNALKNFITQNVTAKRHGFLWLKKQKDTAIDYFLDKLDEAMEPIEDEYFVGASATTYAMITAEVHTKFTDHTRALDGATALLNANQDINVRGITQNARADNYIKILFEQRHSTSTLNEAFAYHPDHDHTHDQAIIDAVKLLRDVQNDVTC